MLNVQIHLDSVIRQACDSDHAERMQQTLAGSVYKVGAVWYIRYQENAPDGEPDRQDCTVVWKIAEDRITLMRMGPWQMRQEFVEGEISHGFYQTPFGKLDLQVETRLMHWRASRTALEQIQVEYVLSIQDSKSLAAISLKLEPMGK